MAFTAWAVPSLLAFALSIILGVYVLYRNPKNPANRAFAIWMLFFALWTFGELNMRLSESPSAVLFWGRFAFLGSFFIAPSFASFIFRLLGKKTNTALLYLPFVPFLFALPTELIVKKELGLMPWGYDFENGALYPVFGMFFMALVAYAWHSLWKARREVEGPLARKKLGIVLYSSVIAIALGGFTDVVLPSLGIYTFTLASTFTAIMAVAILYAFLLKE